MDIHKFHQWSSYLFSLIVNTFNRKSSLPEKLTAEQVKPTSSTLNDLSKAKKQLIDGFTDLSIILESFYSLYTIDITDKSEYCEHYQQQAIQLALLIKDKFSKETSTLEFAFELLHHSDTFKLFHTLQQLKDYRDELPSGWYESIKLPINNINQANLVYLSFKDITTH